MKYAQRRPFAGRLIGRFFAPPERAEYIQEYPKALRDERPTSA